MKTRSGPILLLLSGLVLLVHACGQSPQPIEEPVAETAAAAAEAAADVVEETSGLPAEAMQARMEYADGLDGAKDKVVRHCVTCRFAMDGSEEHAVDHDGYTWQLCSEHCHESFEAAPVAAIATIEIPEGDVAPLEP